MKFKYLFILLALVTIAAVLGYFYYDNQYGNQSSGQNFAETNVRIVMREGLNYPFWIAEEKGYLENKNIETEEVSFPDSNNKDINTTRKNFRKWFNEGNADVAVLSTDELFNMEIEYPGSAKAFLYLSDSENKYSTVLLIHKDSELFTVASLNSKQVMADVFDIDQFLLARFMKASGVDNYKPVKIPRLSWEDNLTNKRADALWATGLASSSLISKGVGKKLVENPNNNPKTEVSGAVNTVVVFRSDFIEKNKSTAESFKQAIGKSLEASDSEIKEVIIKNLGEDIKDAVEKRTFSRIQDSSKVDKGLFQKLADLMFEEEYISKKVNIENLIY